MDQAEKGTLPIVAVPANSHGFSRLLLLASLLLSTMALAMATVACMQLSYNQRLGHFDRVNWPEEIATHGPAESLVVTNGEHIELNRNQRSPSLEICNSSIVSTVLPSAHIVYSSASNMYSIPVPAYARQVILSKNWICNKDKTLTRTGGFVQGGMSYNKETGFLLLPVDGMYFVYSQVMFSARNVPSSQVVKMGHRTVVCRPGDSSCGPSTPMMESMSYPSRAADGNALSSHYHGGVLSATAGTQVAVAGWYDTNLPDGSLLIDTHWSHSYMGAFLIQAPYNDSFPLD